MTSPSTIDAVLDRQETLEAVARWSDCALMMFGAGHEECFRQSAEMAASFALDLQGREKL